MDEGGKRTFRRFPVISHGAEHLVRGYLMRRNIMTFEAPPNNEGYDLICIHPDPRRRGRQVRVQVKSRYATDCGKSFPVQQKSLGAFDFLVVAFLNVGRFGRGAKGPEDVQAPEFYTLPASVIRRRLDTRSSWHKVKLYEIDPRQLRRYKDEAGFDLIARKLGIPRPAR